MTKYNFTSKSNDYHTPPEIYKPILDFIGQDKFCLDVCCSAKNIPAKIHIVAGYDNGLKIDWNHRVCWMNPPYNQCDKWVAKAYHETQKGWGEVWGIIPNRTETKYFHKYILGNPDSFRILLKKEWSFIHPETGDYCRDKEGKKAVYKNPLCIVYFGKRAKEYAYYLKEKPILNGVVVE